LVANGKNYCYRDLLNLSLETKKKIQELGIGEGNVVVILGDFSINSIAAMISCFMVNATVVPVTEDAYMKLKQQLDLMKPDFFINTLFSSVSVSEYVSDLDGGDAWRALVPEAEPGLIVFTSGTTGTPKAIMHSVDALCYRYTDIKPALTCMCFLKFDHMGGFNTIFGMLFRGGTAVIPSRLDPESICSEIEKYKVNLLPSTPSFLTQLIMSNSIKLFDLGSLKVISYGTEVMSENYFVKAE